MKQLVIIAYENAICSSPIRSFFLFRVITTKATATQMPSISRRSKTPTITPATAPPFRFPVLGPVMVIPTAVCVSEKFAYDMVETILVCAWVNKED